MPSEKRAEDRRRLPEPKSRAFILTQAVSRIGGRIAGLHVPKPLRPLVWHGIASLLKVDLTSVPRPLTRYRNLSAFFSRGLPESALSVDPNPQVLVSPVSGIFLGGFPIAEERIIPVKGNPHRLDDLLGGRERIEPFLGGEGYTFYLRPRDYHRIHAFSDMTLYACELFPGTLFPVNRLGQKIPGVFSRNERWVLMGEALWGKVAMVWVGALFVGSLRFLDPRLIPHTPTLKDPYQQFRVSFKKGEEIGCFNLGSTVILLLSAHFSPLLSPGSEVRVGEGVLHIV